MKLMLLSFFVILGFASAAANEVRILAWDDSVATRPLAWIQGEEYIEISGLHPLRRSKSYPLTGSDAPVVIRALDRMQGEEKTAAELRCAVDPKFRRPLLILLPDPVAPSGLRGLVIEDDMSSFGWGSMRFVNASGTDVVVQVERKAARVPAGWKPVDINPGGLSRNVGIRIALAGTIETPAYTSVWDHRDDARSLIFVLRGGESRLGSLVVKAVPELKGEDASATRVE
jgi:hypothetical protein